MFKWILIALLAILAVLGGALVWLSARNDPELPMIEANLEQMDESPNVTVYVRQSAVNNMLQAIFPIAGEGRILRQPLAIHYSWRVEHPHVEMTTDGPVFSAEAVVRIFGGTHTVKAEAQAGIRYDSLAQELYLELHQLQTRTDASVVGISIDKLNLVSSDMDVRLLRHLPLFTPFIVKKPKGVQENVEFSIVGHQIRYEKQRAVVDFAVHFRKISEGVQDTTQSAKQK